MFEDLYVAWLRFIAFFEDRSFGAPRSNQWPTIRKAYLAAHPNCEACGRDKYIQIHHVQSFATQPELELDPNNLISLCEGMESNCHRLIGHLQNYKSLNVHSRKDAAQWLFKIQNRPAWDGKQWVYPNPLETV